MSAPWPSSTSMRGHRRNMPMFLLLLWLLTGTWTRIVSSQDEAAEEISQTVEEEVTEDQEQVVEDTETSEPTLPIPEAPPTSEPSPTQGEGSDSELIPEDKTEDPGSGVDTPEGSTDDSALLDSTSSPQSGEGLSITVILIPVALVVFTIAVIMFALFLRRRFKMEAAVRESRKDDLYLDGSSTEKVPMPMFEEDVPSVLELEMEELDQWMIKDG